MINVIKRNMVVTAILTGEIDHCTADEMRREIEKAIADPGVKELRLDFTHVTFMDSSGVGMLIGRYRTMIQKNGRVSATGLTPQMERLFRFAGLHRIIAIEEAKGEAANE